ncbi:MAG: response regulator transcription factor [Fuerstiella sp.]|nr:response regulator transcription factor [Fuerstiella sp.]
MSEYKILIIEDDRSLSEVLVYNLEQVGYSLSVAHDGQDGLNRARYDPPDVIVLDLMLPVVDGLEVCRRIRADRKLQNVLILMLTAKAEESDHVVGLAIGADDYVTKPFSIKVLLERIKALLRRRVKGSVDDHVIVSQGIVLDKQRHSVTVNKEFIELTRSEFSLLEMMMCQPGRAFSRGELVAAGLGDSHVLERTIDVHIRAIRRKFGTAADLIQTVRGIGYRFRDPAR